MSGERDCLVTVIGKDLEGSSHGPVKILSWYLPGRSKENHGNLRLGGVLADI
jgi:hypothetical protein